jgi:hypothetical protein
MFVWEGNENSLEIRGRAEEEGGGLLITHFMQLLSNG